MAAGAPVLILRAAGRGWVLRAGVSDRDVVRVALGDRAQITFDALPGRAFAATVADRHYVMEHGLIVDMIANAELDRHMDKLHGYLGV